MNKMIMSHKLFLCSKGDDEKKEKKMAKKGNRFLFLEYLVLISV